MVDVPCSTWALDGGGRDARSQARDCSVGIRRRGHDQEAQGVKVTEAALGERRAGRRPQSLNFANKSVMKMDIKTVDTKKGSLQKEVEVEAGEKSKPR